MENKKPPLQQQPSTGTVPEKPLYQKPTVRKYDQVEQVKPYGPSEI